jgi:hypothetical protein
LIQVVTGEPECPNLAGPLANATAVRVKFELHPPQMFKDSAHLTCKISRN